MRAANTIGSVASSNVSMLNTHNKIGKEGKASCRLCFLGANNKSLRRLGYRSPRRMADGRMSTRLQCSVLALAALIAHIDNALSDFGGNVGQCNM